MRSRAITRLSKMRVTSHSGDKSSRLVLIDPELVGRERLKESITGFKYGFN